MNTMRDRSADANHGRGPGDFAESTQRWPDVATWQQESAAMASSRQDGVHGSNIGDTATDFDPASAASTVAQAGSEYRVLPSSTDSGGQEHHTANGHAAEPSSLDESTAGAESSHESQQSQGKQRPRLNKVSNKGTEADLLPTEVPRRRGPNKCYTMTICCAVVVLPLVLLGAALGLLTTRNAARRAAQAFVDITDTLLDMCGESNTSEACRDTLERMKFSMKADADPCDDFYESVCGNWVPRYKNRPTYLEEHVESFNIRVHEALLVKAAIVPPLTNQRAVALHQMAVFHNSCYAMAIGRVRGGSVSEVATVLGVNVVYWLNVTSFDALMNLVIYTTLKTGLPSFIRGTDRQGTSRTELGETLISTLRSHSKMSEYLLKTLPALNVNFKRQFNLLYELDRAVEKIRAASDQSLQAGPNSKSTKPALFNVSQEHGKAPHVGIPTTRREGNLREGTVIDAVVGRLKSAPLFTAAVYALTVLLSQVMKYALLLRELYVPHPSEGVRWCLRLTAAHFDAIYPDWVASTFQRRDALAFITGVFADIRVLLMRDNRVNQGVVVHTGHLKRSPLKYYGDSEAIARATPPLNLRHRLNESFLRNLAILIRNRVGRDPVNERAADVVVSGHLGYVGDWFVVTPSYLCGHGLLSLRDDEVGVHYPTVASFILRAVFDDSAIYSPADLANYTGECFSESVSFALGKYVPPKAVMPYMGARWAALYSAFLSRRWAADARKRHQFTDRERTHLFFRLNCFVGCGDPVIRDLCNDVAYSSDAFSRAMGCKREREVHCDCDRIDDCRTLVPGE